MSPSTKYGFEAWAVCRRAAGLHMRRGMRAAVLVPGRAWQLVLKASPFVFVLRHVFAPLHLLLLLSTY